MKASSTLAAAAAAQTAAAGRRGKAVDLTYQAMVAAAGELLSAGDEVAATDRVTLAAAADLDRALSRSPHGRVLFAHGGGVRCMQPGAAAADVTHLITEVFGPLGSLDEATRGRISTVLNLHHWSDLDPDSLPRRKSRLDRR